MLHLRFVLIRKFKVLAVFSESEKKTDTCDVLKKIKLIVHVEFCEYVINE
jgi:hypothetical protein